MTRKLWVITAALFCIILILIAVFVLFLRTNNNTELTLNEAKQVVLKQYEGTIVGAESNGDSYVFRLKSPTGLYELNVDKDHSGITAIESIERYPSNDSDSNNESSSDKVPAADKGSIPQPPPSSLPDNEPSPNPAVLLTKEEAIKLATGKVAGIVTEVDIEQVQGRWYYLVELDTSDGRDADVQIDAASGEVVSVTWDDDDDDDDDIDEEG